MPFCHFWNFDFSNLRITLAKGITGRETLSKGFGEKCKHTVLALNFVQKQNFS